MRTRTKTSINRSVTVLPAINQPLLDVNRVQRNVFNDVSHVVPVDFTDSYMIDAIGQDKPHPCIHRSRTVRIAPAPALEYQYKESDAQQYSRDVVIHAGNVDRWYFAYANDVANYLPWNMAVAATPARLTVSPPDVVDYKVYDDLMAKAQSRIVEMGQNIIEADDIPRSIRSIFSRPFYTDNVRFRLAWDKARYLGKVGKYASGAYLAYKFAFAPLISDMQKTTKVLQNFGAELRRYLKRQRIHTSKSYPINIGFNCSDTVIEVTNGRTTKNQKVTWTPQSDGCFLRYVMVAHPTARYVTDLFRSLDMLSRRLLGTPVQVAWEVIPYSFVVDWFVDMRSVVNAIDRCLGTSSIAVDGCFKTLKWAGSIGVTESRAGSVAKTIYVNQPVATVDMMGYTRELIRPGYFPRIDLRFGKNQAKISLALITQLIARAKRW